MPYTDPRSGYRQEIIALMSIVDQAQSLNGTPTVWFDAELADALEQLEPDIMRYDEQRAPAVYEAARARVLDLLVEAVRASLNYARLPSAADVPAAKPAPKAAA